MKRILTFALAIFATASVNAQDTPQIPNNFDGDWTECHPWEKNGNVSAPFGTQPSGWTVSNVPNSMAGTVGTQVDGIDNHKAVKLTNTAALGNGIPAYMTLGTTWATAETRVTSVRNKDGGVFGGIPFTGRPIKLKIVYKRDGKDKADNSTVVAYLWKGTWKQEAVPSNTAVGVLSWGSATKVEMIDRDNNILGSETLTGGAVTKTEGAELIATLSKTISGTVAEWETLEIPFDYKSEATPEKINVVISAAGYHDDGGVITEGVSITIASVELIYAETTSVGPSFVDAPSLPTPAYNIAGQRVADNATGIVIKNGKKFINK